MASIHSIYIFLFVCLFLEHLDHLYWITRSGALNSKNKEIICVTLRIIQHMVMSSDLVGPGLVPFYRQLLPMFNKYKTYEGKINLICILCVCWCISWQSIITQLSLQLNSIILPICRSVYSDLWRYGRLYAEKELQCECFGWRNITGTGTAWRWRCIYQY